MDRSFKIVLRIAALSVLIVLLGIFVTLAHQAWPILKITGPVFFKNVQWNPVTADFGAGAFVYGTLVTSAIAIFLATPIGVASALFLTEVCPKWLASILGFFIEMLAAIPSVVYGLWGIFVLAPWARDHLHPLLANAWGFLPIFQGDSFGLGYLTAGMILALMILPTISSLCRETFRAQPQIQRDAAFGLGLTQWEMIKISVINASKRGILAAILLGLGRAFGETMAVTMVIGNRNAISSSLFSAGQSMASVIANEYAEANEASHISALMAVGLGLFCISLTVNTLARLHLRRSE